LNPGRNRSFALDFIEKIAKIGLMPHNPVAKERMPDPNAEESRQVLKKLETLWMGGASGPFSDKALELAYEPVLMGSMDDADAIGRRTDDCGDVLEIFLKADSGVITRSSFMCDGCGASMACGSAAAQLVHGKAIEAANAVRAESILEFLGGLPDSHRHAADDWCEALADALRKISRSAAWRRPEETNE
jgi:nitrogen fixation protein NifU and related proteins